MFNGDVETDDLVLYVEYGGRTYISLPEIITGQMTRVDRDKNNELYITVNGAEYRQSFIPDAASKVDVELTHFDIGELPDDDIVPFKTDYDFILDSNGYVVAVRPAEESVTNYALVLESAWTLNALTRSGEVKILKADGTEGTYSINWKGSVGDGKAFANNTALEDYLGTRDVNTVAGGAQSTLNAAVGTVITYTLSDDDQLTITDVLSLHNGITNGYVNNTNEKLVHGNGAYAYMETNTHSVGDVADLGNNLQWTLSADGYDNGDANITVVNGGRRATYAIDLNTVAFYYYYDAVNRKTVYGVATGWDDMGDVNGNADVQIYPVSRKNADKQWVNTELAGVVLFNAETVTTSQDYMLVLNRNALTDADELWLNVVFEDGTAAEVEIDDITVAGVDFEDEADYMQAYAYVENSDGTYDIVDQIGEDDARLLRVGTVDQDNHAYWTLPSNAKIWDVTDVDSAKDEVPEGRFTFNDVNAVIIPTTTNNGTTIRTAFVWEIDEDTDEVVDPELLGLEVTVRNGVITYYNPENKDVDTVSAAIVSELTKAGYTNIDVKVVGGVLGQVTAKLNGRSYTFNAPTRVFAPSTVTGMTAAVNTSNFPNKDNINEMLPKMWTGASDVQGLTFGTIFTWDGPTKQLTVDKSEAAKVSGWVTTQWGGTSVPVAVTLASGYGPKTADANWNNACIIWVDLSKDSATDYTVVLNDNTEVTLTVDYTA